MSSESMAHQVEYEEVVKNLDMGAVLEGTRWEDSFDEGEPFTKEIGGLLGAMGGYALGELLGRGVGGFIDRELEVMDKRRNEDAEAAGEADDQRQSESSVKTASDQHDDGDQQDASVGTPTDRDESPSQAEEDAGESADEGLDEDVSDIGGDSE